MFERVETLVQLWHRDRNLIAGSTDEAQFTKLQEEVEELHVSIGKGNSPIDDIGDIMVVLINIAERNGLSLTECLEHAYDEIKYRRGKMMGGVFVKEDTHSDEDEYPPMQQWEIDEALADIIGDDKWLEKQQAKTNDNI